MADAGVDGYGPAAGCVTLRFYAELNEFLPKPLRGRPCEVPYPAPRSVKDLIEAQGVPHTEVDLILVNGEPSGFEVTPSPGALVSVYPVFESFDLAGLARLGRPPLRIAQFVADVHLGKLVRRLRLLGFDCLASPAWDDARLADISSRDRRVLLTRDRGLLMRAAVSRGIYLHSDQPTEQLRQVLRRLDLYRLASPMSRCLNCNGALAAVPRESVRGEVPPRTYAYAADYMRCSSCRQVYWKGTHWEKLRQFVAQILAEGRCPPEDPRSTPPCEPSAASGAAVEEAAGADSLQPGGFAPCRNP